MPQGLIYTSGLHHATILCNIAKQHGQSAILGVSVLQIADTAFSTIGIK